MKAFLDDRQRAHDPANFMAMGRPKPNPEVPDRVEALRSGALAAGCEIEMPSEAGLGPIAAIHSSEYLAFLQTIHARWVKLPGASDEVIPNVHARVRTDSYPQSPVGQAGYHQADTACPISGQTWSSAYWSAQSAVAAADTVIAGQQHVYALCRPPGHHAYQDQAGGFCFLNNSAIAAERLLRAGLRPVILDIDVHHGNGTQGVFYGRGDVLTVSIHADPAGFYPFFWGHAHERGAGAGLGANLNLPLPMGSDTDAMLGALDQSFERIAAFNADVIVVALGLDAHESDPFQAMRVTTEGFHAVARAIAGVGLPLVCIQEGGYMSPALGDNLCAFLEGLKG